MNCDRVTERRRDKLQASDTVRPHWGGTHLCAASDVDGEYRVRPAALGVQTGARGGAAGEADSQTLS